MTRNGWRWTTGGSLQRLGPAVMAPTRKLTSNRHPGPCYKCSTDVARGAGSILRDHTERWRLYCKGCMS